MPARDKVLVTPAPRVQTVQRINSDDDLFGSATAGVLEFDFSGTTNDADWQFGWHITSRP
jgi:hypothetical protein